MNDDITSLSRMLYCLQQKEFLLNMQLGQAMQSVFGDREGMFKKWMYESSDIIQGAAVAYGERIVAEWVLDAVAKSSEDNQAVLEQITKLYLVDCIERSLDFYMINKLLTVEQGALMKHMKTETVKDLSPHLLKLVESFGIPNELLYAPIANEWELYNASNNEGEIKNVTYF